MIHGCIELLRSCSRSLQRFVVFFWQTWAIALAGSAASGDSGNMKQSELYKYSCLREKIPDVFVCRGWWKSLKTLQKGMLFVCWSGGRRKKTFWPNKCSFQTTSNLFRWWFHPFFFFFLFNPQNCLALVVSCQVRQLGEVFTICS